MFDLAIVRGFVYRSGDFFRENVYIKGGKIAAVTSEVLEAREVYSADGLWVLPGFIDPHVHFSLRVGKWTSVDDFFSGSVSAAFGGITTFIDFIDPVKSVAEMEEAFKRRLEEAKSSVVDYAFHATIASPTDAPGDIASKAKELGMASIKLFTTYSSSNRRTYDDYIEELLRLSSEMEFVVVVHAENDEIIKKMEGKNVPPKDHSRARPTIAELSEVLKLAAMAKYHKGQLYIVHISSGITAKEIWERYGDILGLHLITESCPHYFWLDESVYSREDGKLFLMTPPLRSLDEVETLRDYFDAIVTIGTDHCSFMRKEKMEGNFTHGIPQGIGGVEFSFSLMYTLFGPGVIDKFTKNVAKVYGLYPKKGVIEVGSDADLVVFDPDERWFVQSHHSRSDYDVYEGLELHGRVITTLSKGRFVVKNGEFVGEKGWGSFLEREAIRWL